MIDLDDGSELTRLDPDGFLEAVETFPSQVRRGADLAWACEGIEAPQELRSIAVLGMGGSGISGDVLGALLARGRHFVGTVKDYDLPGWVGAETLVFAASYSGDTEETLSALHQARGRGARIVGVSTGGALKGVSSHASFPVIEVPAGLQPRAALGYLAIPLLVICERLGIVSDAQRDIDEAIELLERRSKEYGRSSPAESNVAKQLAQHLAGRIPVIYGSEGISAVAAYRWKCQFNECSKIPAYHHVFPELNHNEIVGWDHLQALTHESMALVVLRHEGEHPRVSKRIEITLPLINKHLGHVQLVRAQGNSPLARMLDLIYLGDFTATYLALAEGIDPSPVPPIAELKRKMSE